MADLKEQRVCLNFCFLLEKSTTEAYQMLQQVFKMDAMNVHKFLNGLDTLNLVRCMLKIMFDLGAIYNLKMMKTLKKSAKKLMRIIVSLLTKISEQTGVSWSLCHQSLTEDLQIRHVAVFLFLACSHRIKIPFYLNLSLT